jgi:hypothetical protein
MLLTTSATSTPIVGITFLKPLSGRAPGWPGLHFVTRPGWARPPPTA